MDEEKMEKTGERAGKKRKGDSRLVYFYSKATGNNSRERFFGDEVRIFVFNLKVFIKE